MAYDGLALVTNSLPDHDIFTITLHLHMRVCGHGLPPFVTGTAWQRRHHKSFPCLLMSVTCENETDQERT